MNGNERVLDIFINIATEIYESVYENKLGKEVTLNAELKSGKKLQIKITMEE